MSPSRAGDREHGPRYCCFGCRFAAAIAADGDDHGRNRWTLARLGLAIFFTMNVMVFTMALWARDVYGLPQSATDRTAASLNELFRFACLFFSAPVLILLGKPLLDEAWNNLRRGVITMDWLLALGVAASFAYSAVSLWQGAPHVYFEVGCVVLVAVTLGRWLEATGKAKTTEALLSLQRLLPDKALVLQDEQVHAVPLEQVQIGAVIVIGPGQRIPLDGVIIRNQASIDEQMVTGESQPVCKRVGDRLYAGSLNLDGDLLLRVSSPASAGTMQRLVDAIRRAIANKGREQRLADRITAWFTPVLAILTCAAFVVHTWVDGFQSGLMAALATVLIACPCALGIATPMAIWAALGRASCQQVLFRDGDALSRLARVNHIALDKTGTLTTGQPTVLRVVIDPHTSAEQFARVTRSMTATSDHVLARAIRKHYIQVDDVACTQITTVPGCGLKGNVPGVSADVYLGSLRFLREAGLVSPATIEKMIDICHSNGQMYSTLGWSGRIRGVVIFEEELRPQAAGAIGALQAMGIEVTMLTGDHQRRAERVAADLGIEARSEMLPEEKLQAMNESRRAKRSTAMVGDGINDVGALSAADVGIALGCGADITRSSADVCLLGNDLQKLPWAIGMARKSVRIVRQNLFWAFGYNVIGLLLAMGNLLNPIVAAAAMILSSLFVVVNSLRLRGEGQLVTNS